MAELCTTGAQFAAEGGFLGDIVGAHDGVLGATTPAAAAVTSLRTTSAQVIQKRAIATITTAGVATYTIAQLLGGLIKRDPNGAGRSDIMPTGALAAAGLPGGVAVAGDSFEFQITNDASGAYTITVTAGASGSTLVGTMTIAQNASRRFLVVFTSASAYTAYSIGSFTT